MDLFLKRIQSYIPDEFDAFKETLNQKMYQGLRVNTSKISKDKFIRIFKDIEGQTPFCENGFYISKSLGNHPFHMSGLYYLQEPSAMSVVECLDIKEEDVVLDLCAAPGGKSSQIVTRLKNGFLVSNEIDAKRCKILLSNMERMGFMNVAITNAKPETLCSAFPSCFDKVLVDAPCSGEGMMKKHSMAYQEWSYENILYCQKRQLDILEQAYKALRKDGILVYSTCTYAKEENEEVIVSFLKRHKDMQLIDIERNFGRSGLKTDGLDEKKVRRIFPMDHGEGHFVAKLKKIEGDIKYLPILKKEKIDPLAQKFLKEQLNWLYPYMHTVSNSIFCMNREFVDFKKVKCIRQGLYCGDIIKKRFEPSHAFYMNNDLENIKHKINLDFEQANQFIHGLSLDLKCDKGYVATCFEGYPFGFGKSDGNVIKNKIPKGLRLMEGQSLYGKK